MKFLATINTPSLTLRREKRQVLTNADGSTFATLEAWELTIPSIRQGLTNALQSLFNTLTPVYGVA